MKYERLTKTNFNEYSLDDFVRHQDVKQCWRNIDGEWKLLPIEFIEDWNLEKCRKSAKDIFDNLDESIVGFGAFENDRVVGYITIGTDFLAA